MVMQSCNRICLGIGGRVWLVGMQRSIGLLCSLSCIMFQSMSFAAVPKEEAQREEVLFSPQQDTLRRKLIELIDAEQASLKIAIYSMTDPAIINALGRAIKKGVLVDIVVNGLKMQAEIIYALRESSGNKLIPKNLHVKIAAIPGIKTMHHKFVIFEKNRASKSLVWIGSYNFTLYPGSEQTHDNVVILDDPVMILKFWSYFSKLSAIQGTDCPAGKGLVWDCHRDDIKDVLFFPHSPGTFFVDTLLWLIVQEKKFIKIAMDEFTEPFMISILSQSPRYRSVPAELVIFKTSPVPDRKKMDCNDIELLRSEGVQVYQYTGTGGTLMHHKFAVFGSNHSSVDCRSVNGKSLVWTGSYNITKSAASSNCESVVILDSPDIVQQFNSKFDELKNCYCQRL